MTAQSRSASPSPTGASGRARIAQARPRPPAARRRTARARAACQNTRSIDLARRVRSTGGAGSGVPGRRRQQPVHVRLGVEDEEADLRVQRRADVARRCSRAPIDAAEPREARGRRCRRPAPTGCCTRTPAPLPLGTVIGPAPAAGPTRSTGVSDDSGTDAVGADTSSASAQAGCTAPASFDPVSCTTSHSACRARDVDVERRSAAAERPATGAVVAGSPAPAAVRRASGARRATAGASASRRSPAPAPAASSPASRGSRSPGRGSGGPARGSGRSRPRASRARRTPPSWPGSAAAPWLHPCRSAAGAPRSIRSTGRFPTRR